LILLVSCYSTNFIAFSLNKLAVQRLGKYLVAYFCYFFYFDLKKLVNLLNLDDGKLMSIISHTHTHTHTRY